MSALERKFLRVPVDAAITIRPMDETIGPTEWPGTCSDISVAGMKFHSRHRFPVGAAIEIDIHAAEAVITARVQVLRVESAGEGHVHGARFIQEDVRTASTLEDLVLL